MTNAIATRAPSAIAAFSMDERELLSVLESSLYPGANPASIKLVVSYCKAAGLDPIQKPVHIVPMWDKKARAMRDVIMPGIGSYRVQAARTGCLGISEPEFGPDVSGTVGDTIMTYPKWCRVTVKRDVGGVVAEFSAVERWVENYATAGKDTESPNNMWRKRPYAQLAKCAEAQALRKAFPEVGAAPTADEMEGKELGDDAQTVRQMGTAEVVRPPEPEVWTADAWEKTLPKILAGIKKGKTIEQALAWLSGKARVSPEQEADLRKRAADQHKQAPQEASQAPGEPLQTPEAAFTYAEVADRLNNAKDMEELAEAGSVISGVRQDQRAELVAIFEKRATEFEGVAA